MPATALQIYLRKRLESGSTLQQIADELGVTRQAVHNWKHGARYPTAELVPSIADRTGIGLRELLEQRE